MKKTFFAIVIIIGLISTVFAQSGRKNKVTSLPFPTPTPVDETVYSESKPGRIISINQQVTLRGNTTIEKTPTTKPKDNTTDQKETTEEDILRIDTSLVMIPVSVFDRNGLFIPNLRQSEFKIFENGKEQEIEYFGTTEQPFTVVLLLDTSPSTRFKIDEIQNAAISFVDQLKPQDQVMVIEFDSNIHVLSEATNNRQQLYKAIRRADFGGGTALYDAVDFALRKRLDTVAGRKAIVLFTDGVDTTSFKASYDSTLRIAEEANAMIFPIYYNTYLDQVGGGTSPFPPVINFPFPGGGMGRGNPGTSRGAYELGKRYLDELALRTGGRVHKAESQYSSLETAFYEIAEELRRQYSLGYYPADTGKAGDRKLIKVRVYRPNLVIKTRDSYIVGAENTKQTNQTPNNKFLSKN
jgi:VWFA-related protein